MVVTIASGNLTKLLKMAIYSEFSHPKSQFSIARVTFFFVTIGGYHMVLQPMGTYIYIYNITYI